MCGNLLEMVRLFVIRALVFVFGHDAYKCLAEEVRVKFKIISQNFQYSHKNYIEVL